MWGRVSLNATAAKHTSQPTHLEWRERAKTDKDILLFDCDSIGVIEINGLRFAEDCECEGWAPYRDFIFQHRSDIRHFLVRLSEEAQEALKMEETYNVLKNKKINIIDNPLF